MGMSRRPLSHPLHSTSLLSPLRRRPLHPRHHHHCHTPSVPVLVPVPVPVPVPSFLCAPSRVSTTAPRSFLAVAGAQPPLADSLFALSALIDSELRPRPLAGWLLASSPSATAAAATTTSAAGCCWCGCYRGVETHWSEANKQPSAHPAQLSLPSRHSQQSFHPGGTHMRKTDCGAPS